MRLRRDAAIWLAVITLLCTQLPAVARPDQAAPGERSVAASAAGPFRSYLVRVAAPNVLVPSAEADELAAQAWQERTDEVRDRLAALVEGGLADEFAFVQTEAAFRAELSDSARDELAGNPLVAAVEPVSENPGQENGRAGASLQAGPAAQSGVSSVIFAQVHTPFVWGNTNIGGLTVQLTLEDAAGMVKGIPSVPTTRSAACQTLPHCVKVAQNLYFETTFVDAVSQQYVSMRPGDFVHVITSGDDPATPGVDLPQDKRVPIVEVSAYASPDQDWVAGTTLPNAAVIVTFGTGLSVPANYLTPGSSMTFAETAANASGEFSAATFRTSSSTTYKTVSFVQGSRGFVRVRVSAEGANQPVGDEVFALHGQNIYILENSSMLHGYAFPIPSTPGGVEPGVAAPRPAATVTVALKNASGLDKASTTMAVAAPYKITFSQAVIYGGDIVDVTISYAGAAALTYAVQTAPIAGQIDLAGNQVVGSGPPNTRVAITAGSPRGYVAGTTTFDAYEAQVTSAGDGSFATGAIHCGASNYLLKPGSFGYAGYEGDYGSFIYSAYAAPANYVMSDFTFVDGWIADGLSLPTIAVAAADGSPKQPPSPGLVSSLWLVDDKLWINVYYQASTSVYMAPGDVVTIASGNFTHTIPVDSLTARLYAAQEIVAGDAPPGASLRVVPEKDRSARNVLSANAAGDYAARNPYLTNNASSCTFSPKTESLSFGDVGRVFLAHPDGNEVFTTFYTRALRVLENEGAKAVSATVFPLRGLEWNNIVPWSDRLVTVKYSPRPSETGSGTASYTLKGRGTKTSDLDVLSDADLKTTVIIRGGGSITVTYQEGPAGLTRPVTLTLSPLPLIIGSPDMDTNTIAGVGPVHWTGPDTAALAGLGVIDWQGTAALKIPFGSSVAIPHNENTAYPPLQFKSGSSVVPLKPDYRGTVSYVAPLGDEVYMWWGVTNIAYKVKITPRPRAGATEVCGHVTPPSGLPATVDVRIHDLTQNPQDLIIGTGPSDDQGAFCVIVSPPLYCGQVILAEVAGSWSQPAVVMIPLFIPYARR